MTQRKKYDDTDLLDLRYNSIGYIEKQIEKSEIEKEKLENKIKENKITTEQIKKELKEVQNELSKLKNERL